MSSPCIKLQSLIRKFKNLTKEQMDKNKVITEYQYDLSISDVVLSTDFLFQSNSKDLYVYDLCNKPKQMPSNNSPQKTLPINIIDTYKYNTGIPWDEIEDNLENIINDYIDTVFNSKITRGHLNNVFNTELCDETWLINLFILDKIHYNFIVNDNVKIKSLHIGDISTLSAYNHYLFNGSLPELVNAEWSWLNTNITFNDKNPIIKHINNKFYNNILQLLENNIYSANNINYVINEVNNKLVKINFFAINYTDQCLNADDICYNNHNSNNNKTNHIYNNIHAAYASFVIKLMDINSILFIKIPNVSEWDTQFINIMLVYALLFNETFVFKFDLTTKSTYLLCKNKKKISNETVYKKLIHIISNKDFTDDCNLFSKEIFKLPVIKNWLENIFKIMDYDEAETTSFDTILSAVNSTLKINTETFL
jgi:hypothetical protein